MTERIASFPPSQEKRSTIDQVKKFQQRYGDHLGVNCATMFVGKSLSGKTFSAKCLFEDYYKHFISKGKAYLFSPVAGFENWQELFPSYFLPQNIYESSSEDRLLKLLKSIKDEFESGDGSFGQHEIQSLLVLDDQASGTHSWSRFTSELCRCRHYGLNVWIMCQSPLFASPGQREQAYNHSISCDYTSPDDLRRLAFGKSIETIRKPTTPKDQPTLQEALAKVRLINKQKGNKYGRLYFSTSSGERLFFWQNGSKLETLFPDGLDIVCEKEPKPKKTKKKPEVFTRSKQEIPDETYSSDEY